MKNIRFTLTALCIFISFFYLASFVYAWDFYGYTYDINGIPLNHTLINITVWSMGGPGGPSLVQSFSNYSNESGWFNFSVVENISWMYKPILTHTNETSHIVDWVGKSLPMFPFQEFNGTTNIKFYLSPAGTINITAINRTGDLIPFGYMIKDTKLGYEVSMSTNASSSGVLVYVPRDRNYSIMIWPADGDSNHFVPVSFDWNNFTSPTNYTFDSGLSNYNATTKTVNKQFNVTENFAWISGYINDPSIEGWDDFKIAAYVLEPSNMVSMDRGGVPFNASAWRPSGGSDQYNLTTGFYNITLPYCPHETVRYLLFAIARNGTNYRGSFRNITVSGSVSNFNFTMYGLLGNTTKNITLSDSMGGADINIATKEQEFNLVNASNTTQILSNINAHLEFTVDYSDYNCTEFSFIEDLSGSGNATIYVPLLNITGIKEINVFSQTYAPRRIGTKTTSQIRDTYSNISMAVFTPGGVENDSIDTANTNFTAYISNETCDVPNPPLSCILTSFHPSPQAMKTNMFPLVIGGGDLSVRIVFNNITVHYAGVDLLASGPPDAMFDSSVTNSTSSGSFEAAMRFGSNGPKIYDYVLISIPYTPGSTSQVGLNESADVNVSIPVLYDEEWNVIWNASTNGTSGSALGGNYSHYSQHSSEWDKLLNPSTCTRNVTEFNSSNPCYLDTSNNKIWIRLPHFSGVEPDITGSATNVSSSEEEGDDGGGGGGSSSGTPSFWTSTYVYDDKNLEEKGPLTREFAKKHRVRLKIDDETHYVGVVNLTDDTATINVSSTPQQKTLSIGEEWKVELTDDSYYDLSVKLNDIKNNKANLTITGIHEEIIEETTPSANQTTTQNETQQTEKTEEVEEEKTEYRWLWIVLAIILVIMVTAIIFYFSFYKKQRYYKNCLLYTSPSPRDLSTSRMPSSA